MKLAIRLLLTLRLSFPLLAAPRKADFNGDGFGDPAVDAPLEDDAAIADSGGVPGLMPLPMSKSRIPRRLRTMLFVIFVSALLVTLN